LRQFGDGTHPADAREDPAPDLLELMRPQSPQPSQASQA
jgi:hypothetical protein